MKTKKAMACILSVLMILSIVPLSVFAAEEGDFSYEVTDGKATITKIASSVSGEVVIPETLGGFPVTDIHERAFDNEADISGLILPDTLEVLRPFVFDAFNICLDELVIPADVREIGCVTGDEGRIKKYIVDENNPYFCSDGYGVIYNKEMTRLVLYPTLSDEKAYTIPDGVDTIGTNAFYSQYTLGELIMPDSIKTIEDEVFYGCAALEKVRLSENLEYIGDCNFYFCFYLKELSLPAALTYVGEESFVELYSLERIKIYSGDVSLSNSLLGYLMLGATSQDHKELGELYYEIFYLTYCLGDTETAKAIAPKLYDYETETDPYLNSYPVYCYKGSLAEEYAIEKNLEYIYLCEEHISEILPGTDASCTGTGLTQGAKCSVCGEILIAQEIIPAKGHSFSPWENDYENNIATRYCESCEATETKELENQGNEDVDIIAPYDPDLDFDIESVDKNGDTFLLVEQTVAENVSAKAEVLRVFDITLKNQNGVHVQPNGSVKVKLPLEAAANGNYKVYRVNEDGTLTDMNAYPEGSHMVFETDHFSIYVIVEENENTDGRKDIFAFLTKLINAITEFLLTFLTILGF